VTAEGTAAGSLPLRRPASSTEGCSRKKEVRLRGLVEEREGGFEDDVCESLLVAIVCQRLQWRHGAILERE
jgi:hypothetical protein